MRAARWGTLARKALQRPPRYVLARLAREARQHARRPWSRIRPRLLTADRLFAHAGVRTLDELWDSRARAPFFLSSASRRTWTPSFLDANAGAAALITAAAEAVLRHEFDLLGSGPCGLGPRLPWHTDFKTGREWPARYAADLDIYDLDRPSDVKVPWELSRCQHFTTLGQAYWLTGDERFAREFAAQVEDWIASNPWMHGVNWVCAMDVALRAVSWIWGFHFFAGSHACRPDGFRLKFLQSLYLHGEFVAGNIEHGDVNGNHYLVDGVGLVFLGTFFADTPAGHRWLETGRRIVLEEILAQTSDDGVDFEGSVAYHRLVLEAFLSSYLLLRARGESIPRPAWDRLERMLEYVAAYTKPDGSVPLHGDADDGRIQKLGSQPINDHRYLLAAGAVAFERADFKAAAGRFADEAFWLLGPEGAARFAGLPAPDEPPRSKAFPSGGIYVMRRGSTHVFIDCAEVGLAGRGGHGHNDCLGFELFLDGANLVSDCGAYVYTASVEWRNRFRSTAFHNTLQVDHEEINRYLEGDLWRLRFDAVPTPVRWSDEEQEVRFSGGHAGYVRLNPPVHVQREIVLDAERHQVFVLDRATGDGRRRLTTRFHLDPRVEPSLEAGGTVRLRADRRHYWFALAGAPPDALVSLEPSWVSPSYGCRTATTAIVVGVTAALPAELSYRFTREAPMANSVGEQARAEVRR